MLLWVATTGEKGPWSETAGATIGASHRTEVDHVNENAHTHEGYPVLPVFDPQTRVVLGWDVPYLRASFLSKEEAYRAIDNRIAEIVAELQRRTAC